MSSAVSTAFDAKAPTSATQRSSLLAQRPDAGIVAPGPLPRTGLVMRIALIAPPWLPVPPPGYGGIEVVIDCLAAGLDAAGHDVLLFTTGDSSARCPRRSSAAAPRASNWDSRSSNSIT